MYLARIPEMYLTEERNSQKANILPKFRLAMNLVKILARFQDSQPSYGNKELPAGNPSWDAGKIMAAGIFIPTKIMAAGIFIPAWNEILPRSRFLFYQGKSHPRP